MFSRLTRPELYSCGINETLDVKSRAEYAGKGALAYASAISFSPPSSINTVLRTFRSARRYT